MAEILVVDDDPAIRTLLSSILRRDGHTVDDAPDGAVALEKLHERSYDAVLLDLMMPRVDGWQVLDDLAHEDPARLSCVIVLSAALPRRGLPTEQEALVYAMVPKPFDIHELKATVRSCVQASTPES